jgi:hypothetical protein
VDGADPAEDDRVVSGRVLVAELAEEHGERVGQHGDAVVRGQCRQAGEAVARPGEPHRELAVLVSEDVHRERAPLARRRPCP